MGVELRQWGEGRATEIIAHSSGAGSHENSGVTVTLGVNTGSEGESEQLPETPTWIEGNAPTRKMFQEWTSDVTVFEYHGHSQ